MELDAETAERVRLADLANVVKKVKSGKPLSKYERSLIDAAQPPRPPDRKNTVIQHNGINEEPAPEWVSSYEKLGEIFGLHRASFPRLIRDHKEDPFLPKPRANGDHNVEAWRQFFDDHPEIRRSAAADDNPQKSDLEREKLLEQIRGIRFSNDLKDARYISLLILVEQLTTVGTEQKGILRDNLEGALPAKLVGMELEQIRFELKTTVDLICERMARLLESLPLLARRTAGEEM